MKQFTRAASPRTSTRIGSGFCAGLAMLLAAGCGGSMAGSANSDGGTGDGGGPIGVIQDACSPYTGSYSGLLPYEWTDATQSPATHGTGQISIAFTATCPAINVPGEQVIQLDITSAMSDFALFGATTMTQVNGGMQMPPSPPASGDKTFGITINFPNARGLNISGPLTVTANAGIISNDILNTTGWGEGDALPGVPASGHVTSNTFKINRN